jgi:hypothetical protein
MFNYCFGFGGCVYCKPSGQYMMNYSFDYGTLGWGFDPKYTAIITDNGDGSVHLKTTSNFGSLVPNNIPKENASWIIELKLINQIGNGKISFRRPNGVWVSTPTIGDGIHTATYSGVIAEIHIGADGDDTYEADYMYISLRRTTDKYVTYRGDTVTYHGLSVKFGE